MRTVLGWLLLASTAAAVEYPLDYPIVYVESEPAPANVRGLLETGHPWPATPSKLVVMRPGGVREVLVDPGPAAAVFDPKVSLDGQYVYYAQCDNVLVLFDNLSPSRPAAGADLWRVNVATGEKQQFPMQTPAPFAGRARSNGLKIFNMGPCPVAGGRVLFTSDREIAGQHQLYVMDNDGKNVEKLGFMNLAGALHPERLSDGRVLWSTFETQGDRRPIVWGLWSTTPDGRDFEPFFSAFVNSAAMHLHTEAANKFIVSTMYYQVSNHGMGTFRAAPLAGGFEHRLDVSAGPVYDGTGGEKIFARTGDYNLTPWTTRQDQPAPTYDKTLPFNSPTGHRVGKVGHPSPAKNPNQVLCIWSYGPVSLRDVTEPALQTGVYLMPLGTTSAFDGAFVPGPTSGPEALIPVVDDPLKNENQPQALLPYAQLFGADPPVEAWLPNAGTEHLPAGTPYALIGTSSVYVRETDALMKDGGVPQITTQGGNALPFSNAAIDSIRILTMEWNTKDGSARYRSALNNDERLRILGEIKLRRFDANGNPILDPGGNPDTSFLAKIRADEPFTFQLLDASGKALTTSKTWHHVRPGERKYDCRGCHAHTKPETRFDFEQSWAAVHPPVDLTQVSPQLVEYKRDVLPILTARGCIGCHTAGTDGAPLLNFSPNADDSFSYRRTVAPIWQVYDSPHSKMINLVSSSDLAVRMPKGGEPLTEDEIKTIVRWIDTGGLNAVTDEALRDDTKPTLFVDSPRSRTQPVTQVRVSAADALLNKASLKVFLNGQPLSMGNDVEGVWTATIPETASGELTAEVQDTAGNMARIVRSFGPGATDPPPPPPPPPPTDLPAQIAALQAQVQALTAERNALQAQVQSLTAERDALRAKIQAIKLIVE